MSADRDWIIEAIYRALVKYDREKRTVRNLRAATRGRGPTIKRGTGRPALAIYLADVVLAALAEQANWPEAAPQYPPLQLGITHTASGGAATREGGESR